jgi:hypothetical protein
LLNIAVVAFKALPLGSHASTPAPNPPFKTILELVLWNGLQSCRRIAPAAINVIKMRTLLSDGRRKWKDNIKMNLNSSGSGYGIVTSSYEHGNEPSGPIKCWEILV